MTLLINRVLLSFETSKYTNLAEMNMTLMPITKVELLSFDRWNMPYPFSKFCDTRLLKYVTLN